ncbi:MAG: hypothetical protein HY360_19265 [Verrucomicrobia bacterium]|nr:hypothetical protein [Verrucomicrobiota bacterium]
MSLQDWARNGWLTEHKTSLGEIADLLAVADRDLSDCGAQGLSEDWQLAIAYNAALQVAITALAACGYRAAREAHHYRAIQSLTLTIGAETKLVALLDGFRKKRNISDYERAGLVSQKEAQEMLALARRLRREIENWLRAKYPGLLGKQSAINGR